MIRTQVYLTEDLYTRIQLEAKRGQKAAEVVRELLQKGLIRQKSKPWGTHFWNYLRSEPKVLVIFPQITIDTFTENNESYDYR